MNPLRLLIGGSPCTYWSIAQTKGRETEPSGIGWELFENYLVALRKYQPNYFLYENNKSMSKAIRAEITKRFGFEPVCINSALVSAQSRQRLYWVGQRDPITGGYHAVPVEQPADCGILLQDILESGVAWREKGYALKAQYCRGIPDNDALKRRMNTQVAEFVIPMPAALKYERSDMAKRLRKRYEAGEIHHGYHEFHELHPRPDGKSNTLTTVLKDNMIIERSNGKTATVYEVKDGQITIKDKQYPIRLADGYYIIRKLTVLECKRLQTVPDSYIFPVSDTQAYKMLGNGWTVDVIAHIMGHFDGITTRPVEVLSMYDGMSCGHIALDKLGARVERYYATEIDKYAIQTTHANYPDTIQLGDAFLVRWGGWPLKEATP